MNRVMTAHQPVMFRRSSIPAWYANAGGHPVPSRPRKCCRRPPLRFCIAWICLCLLLSFLYLLAHPELPTSTRFIGFQQYDSVVPPRTPDVQADSAVVTSQGGNIGPSYPLDVYAPLVHNPVPLTEITVQACFPLWISKCKPLTTPEKDARLGPWVLVDRPLDPATAASRSKKDFDFKSVSGDLFGKLMASFETKFIFYRRSRRTDVPRIVDLKIVETGSDNRPIGGYLAGWHRVKHDLRTTIAGYKSSSKPLHLYYRTVGGTVEDYNDVEGGQKSTLAKNPFDGNPITEVDVLYGSGYPWHGFESVGVISEGDKRLERAEVTLTARRTPIPLPSLPVEPIFNKDGTFKIMQLADLHFSVTHGECRDVSWASNESVCTADNDTISMMERWLDEERPDLVVFSGDQLNGQGTSWDERSVISKWIKPIVDRKILWASIQGNHDSQSGVLTRAGQQAILGQLPFSLTRVGPSNLHDGMGAGNYYIKLRSPTVDSIHLFTMYFLDSGAYAPRDPWHPFSNTGYDWIRQDQIDWMLGISSKITNIARPYVPDGGKDLGKLWDRAQRRKSASSTRGKDSRDDINDEGRVWDTGISSRLSKPKALLFSHIPVPEAFAPSDHDDHGAALSFGEWLETAAVKGAQKKKGVFEALVSQKENRDVIGIFHGHMHNNAGCRRTQGIWVCFCGGSSFAGYGERRMERRTRVISLSDWGEFVETWHRYERTPGRVDRHVLHDERRRKPSS